MGYFVNAKIRIGLADEDVDDILCGALEGGITYWCDECKVVGEYLGKYASEQISRGGALMLHDSEEDKWYKLTPTKFLRGFKLWFENGDDRYGAVSKGRVDTCDIDGEMADMIVQYALFGEIVYG